MKLINVLKNLKTPIVVYNSKDYDFLSKIKKNFNLNFEVYFDSFIPFLDEYFIFSLSNKSLNYENNKIYIFDSVDSINRALGINESFSYEKMDFNIICDKNIAFLSSLKKEEVLSSFENTIFIALKNDPITMSFKNCVLIKGFNDYEKNKVSKNLFQYNENLESFNLIFEDLINVRIFTPIRGLIINNIYLNDKYCFAFIRFYDGYNNLKILGKLKKIFINITGFLIIEDKKIIDYFFNYNILNDKLLEFKNNNYFISFFDIKINKYNLKIRKDKHFF